MTGLLPQALLVFGAGLLSFLSPCVLPLVPGYLAFITGSSTEDLAEGRPSVRDVLIPSLLFVAGFSFVFVALGASASVLGALLQPFKPVLTKVSALVVIAMGVFMLGVIPLPSMYREFRIDPAKSKAWGRGASGLMGMAFAFGWTPCVGPILATVLTLAGSAGDVTRGGLLLLIYSAGLGVPFVLTGVLFGRLRSTLRFLSSRTVLLNRIAGVLLIVMGVLMLTNKLVVIGAFLLKLLPFSVG